MFLTICPVCQRHFSPDDEVNSTVCGHVFHSDCIGRWLSRSTQCPVCHQPSDKTNLIRLFMDNHTVTSPSVGVDIRNRDGVFLRFLVRPGDTVDSLVQELLNSHEVERIYDVLLHGQSLLRSTVSDSSSLLIRDCGISDGDSLHLIESPITRVRVTCLQPRGPRQHALIDLHDGEGLDELRSALKTKLKLPDNSFPLVYASGGVVCGQEGPQRFYRVFEEALGVERLVADWGNREEVTDQSKLQYYSRTILHPGSALPLGHERVLSLKAQLRVEFWKMIPCAENPFLRLHDSPSYFLHDSVCAWFSAHACYGPDGRQRFFLHCFGDVCVDMSSGEKFTGFRMLAKCLPDADLRYCVILVEEGVKFPRFPLRKGQSLMLWIPAGLKVDCSKGSLLVNEGSERSDPDTWYAGRAVTDQLTEYFSPKESKRASWWNFRSS